MISDMDSGEEIDRQLTSKYKDSINQIIRLNQLLQDCHAHSRAGELRKWNWDLDRIWIELGAELKPEEKEGKPNTDKKIEDDFKLICNEVAKSWMLPNKLYDALNKKELFLRRLQEKQGKGSTKVDTDEEDF